MTTLRNQPLAQWSDDEIAERTVKAIGLRQGWRYPDSLNTLSAAGDRTLMDGNVRHFVREALRLYLAGKLPGRRSS
jgi:hypothetical protein